MSLRASGGTIHLDWNNRSRKKKVSIEFDELKNMNISNKQEQFPILFKDRNATGGTIDLNDNLL